jgi:hypothetical protein
MVAIIEYDDPIDATLMSEDEGSDDIKLFDSVEDAQAFIDEYGTEASHYVFVMFPSEGELA